MFMETGSIEAKDIVKILLKMSIYQVMCLKRMKYYRYQKVFRNERNSIREIIQRRWSGLQLSDQVVSTLRFREKRIVLPLELVHQTTILQKDVVVCGRVLNARKSNLFPRMFTL